MNIAIFILPKDDLCSEILKWKKKIDEEFPDQAYTLHPPHLTLITLEIENKLLECIETLDLNYKHLPFEVKVDKKNIFWNDTITNGHTLFYEVEKNNKIFNLQKTIADKLQKFKESIQLTNYKLHDKQAIESFNKYGYPFVGDHWIPHFTISSIKTRKDHPIIKDFLSFKEEYNFIVDRISIWEVNGDFHRKLKTFNLK